MSGASQQSNLTSMFNLTTVASLGVQGLAHAVAGPVAASLITIPRLSGLSVDKIATNLGSHTSVYAAAEQILQNLNASSTPQMQGGQEHKGPHK